MSLHVENSHCHNMHLPKNLQREPCSPLQMHSFFILLADLEFSRGRVGQVENSWKFQGGGGGGKPLGIENPKG